MNKAFAVARWEYLEKVKSKAFIIGLFLTPVIMVGMGILPTLLATQEDKETKAVGIIDRSGDIAAEFAERLQMRYTLSSGRPNYVVLPISLGNSMPLEEAVAEADSQVVRGKIEGYCIVHGTTPQDTVVEYRTRVVGDFMLISRMEENLRTILSEKKASARGLDPNIVRDLRVNLDLKPVKLTEKGEEQEGDFLKVFFSAYVFMMMLFMLIVSSGQLLVRSVIEEKSNRIIEVLVSSCTPTQLMAGKVLGLSALGLTQIGFWALIGLAASLQFGLTIVAPMTGLLLIIYFILGYLLYAAIFIGVGSPVSTEQAAQQITGYLVIILIIPIVMALPAMKNPDALWIKVMTFIPLLTPTMMALRIPISMPATWEIIGSIALLLVSIYAAMFAAGRIFRIAILMTGKTPSLREVFRWIKTG
jgi:ABC-2 type transport system permease protein